MTEIWIEIKTGIVIARGLSDEAICYLRAFNEGIVSLNSPATAKVVYCVTLLS